MISTRRVLRDGWAIGPRPLIWACAAVLGTFVSQTSATDGTPMPLASGPTAALAFEKSFRSRQGYRPITFADCQNITPLTQEMWTKEQVLADFQANRTPDQVGVIVIVKTEFCCKDSRLCAVTTAVMEKQATPLVGRFRVYAAWIKNNPGQKGAAWQAWERKVVREYDFVQGPGARVVAMVPRTDGELKQWSTTATRLGFSRSSFEKRGGSVPKLEEFLQTALKQAPPPSVLSDTAAKSSSNN